VSTVATPVTAALPERVWEHVGEERVTGVVVTAEVR
jgi:hypothetical protein